MNTQPLFASTAANMCACILASLPGFSTDRTSLRNSVCDIVPHRAGPSPAPTVFRSPEQTWLSRMQPRSARALLNPSPEVSRRTVPRSRVGQLFHTPSCRAMDATAARAFLLKINRGGGDMLGKFTAVIHQHHHHHQLSV